MAIVGLPASKDKPKLDFDDFVWQFQNKKIYPSLIGGIKETQEMLDFSVKNKIYPKVQIIPCFSFLSSFPCPPVGKNTFENSGLTYLYCF